ncbi:hypothetical protein [Sphingomonas gei]|uniref:hypothetical protein n=1 Tax=Sphingomonas gei TaxID=1395960 RepID=UPI0014420B2D|nr:hypothetical protein [Sphingomonas gei]
MDDDCRRQIPGIGATARRRVQCWEEAIEPRVREPKANSLLVETINGPFSVQQFTTPVEKINANAKSARS